MLFTNDQCFVNTILVLFHSLHPNQHHIETNRWHTAVCR